MTDEENRLLVALAWMCEQYLGDHAGGLDHMCMGAGEDAVELLMKYGLVDDASRGAKWTEIGKALLDAS